MRANHRRRHVRDGRCKVSVARIKNNWVRRSLIVALVALWPLVVVVGALVQAWPEIWREIRSHWTQGGGFWKAVRECWKGGTK